MKVPLIVRTALDGDCSLCNSVPLSIKMYVSFITKNKLSIATHLTHGKEKHLIIHETPFR